MENNNQEKIANTEVIENTNNENVKSENKNTNESHDNKERLVTKTKLLESGVQYGHQAQWWNPKMKPFISFTKNNVHIINLHKTIASLQNVYTTVQKLTEANKTILFVGTTKQSKDAVRENAERIGAFYVDNRWLGGLLTNFKTIKNSITRLKTLERQEKEGVILKKELDKLNANLGGIKNMRRAPDAIFVSSTKADKIAILEAKKLGIPVIGIVDTNEDPTLIEFPIFANDDAIKSVSLIVTIVADAVASKRGLPVIAAFKGDEAKVLGIDPNYVKPVNNKKRTNSYRPYNNRNNDRRNSTRSFDDNNSSPKKVEKKEETKVSKEA